MEATGDDPQSGVPFRVWHSAMDLPGLAMSRSIGDTMAKNLGVICDPEISFFSAPQDKKLLSIALASDGIWDVYESFEIA
jgi:serine/threonine protein phosphatase PrpC